MKHKIMGVRDGDDFASYEKTLTILSDELAALMNWESEEDYLYDYELTEKQINAIEHTCAISLPDNLTLFLTSSDS
ncbi:pyocin S6 family toxin immunity protein [Pseudomonas putida]|uniref:pyocin S6 family toxin immunity protein n=1 Tax=Pseudomonas putida TaxID=303 RepID=UPI003D966E12